MSVLDIRKPKEPEITEIQFDDTDDRIIMDQHKLVISGRSIDGTNMRRRVAVVDWVHLDNFIEACWKAKELRDRRGK